ncbi:MAG: imidazole glycerol phosphate synthase subunit HisH [Methanobacterium formicicum]
MKVAIVDYGMSNLGSVSRAVEECGGDPIITNKSSDFEIVDKIILPGVGSFRDGIRNIKKLGLDKILSKQVLKDKIPILGICLGMQLMATKGWEIEEKKGLGWIDGEVKLFNQCKSERIPHIGWNEVNFINKSSLFKDIPSGKDFYFVHSYHFICNNEDNILARTPYCNGFTSAISKNNIFGVQFHPEKSQKIGLKLINNFLSI